MTIGEINTVLREFNAIAKRLLEADYPTYNDIAAKFVKHLDSTEPLRAHILSCGSGDEESDALKATMLLYAFSKELQHIDIGKSKKEEVIRIYYILKHFMPKEKNHHGERLAKYIRSVYSSGRVSFDEVRARFNKNVLSVFVDHINNHFEGIKDMIESDEKEKQSVVTHITMNGKSKIEGGINSEISNGKKEINNPKKSSIETVFSWFKKLIGLFAGG